MSKAFIITVFIILIGQPIFAAKFPGYYIDLNGNRIETTFKVKSDLLDGISPNYHKITNSINYLDGKEKVELSAFDCVEIGFYIESDTVVFSSKPNRYFKGKGRVFLRTKLSGSATLYYYYYYTSSSSMGANGTMTTISSRSIGWLIEKENGQTLKVTYGGARRKDLANLFYDYEELAEKILNKDKSVIASDTEAVVKLYNEWKTEQNILEPEIDSEHIPNTVQQDYINLH